MDEFLSFRKMITPIIIQIIFWLSLIVVVLGGLIGIFRGMFIQGLVTIVIGPIFVRVYCELIIILFSIHESLNEIRRSLVKSPK